MISARLSKYMTENRLANKLHLRENWVIFHSTNERSHWIKDNTSSPNLNNSILLKNTNLNNSILLKSVSCCYCYCSATNGIFRSESRTLLRELGKRERYSQTRKESLREREREREKRERERERERQTD